MAPIQVILNWYELNIAIFATNGVYALPTSNINRKNDLWNKIADNVGMVPWMAKKWQLTKQKTRHADIR